MGISSIIILVTSSIGSSNNLICSLFVLKFLGGERRLCCEERELEGLRFIYVCCEEVLERREWVGERREVDGMEKEEGLLRSAGLEICGGRGMGRKGSLRSSMSDVCPAREKSLRKLVCESFRVRVCGMVGSSGRKPGVEELR
jgi:hypothetical protein